MKFKKLQVTPISIIRDDRLQRVDITAETGQSAHYLLEIYDGCKRILSHEFALAGGTSKAALWLEPPAEDFNARCTVSTLKGEKLTEVEFTWKKPREWTFYVMVSSHTDIGLHNSPYIQRYNSSRFIDMAAKLCDETESRPEESRYRYIMEGTWFWNNYAADRGDEAARKIIDCYIKTGKLGICAGVAGNHTQTYGFEELCRSAYSRKWLFEKWGIDCKTMAMIDNNGLSWSMVQPYSNAGYENIIFAPNQWNPLPSTVWKCDRQISGYTWNPEAGGGGSRIDVRYESNLPMLFWWQGADGGRLMVWASTQYGRGGSQFGITNSGKPCVETEDLMAKQLPELEKKYPYDIWLLENYNDDQEPCMKFVNSITEWNKRYKFPQIRMIGNPDEPFSLIRERYGDKIPTLRGDITGGWYQHPLSAAELLAKKFEADRSLATAEKLASVAAVYSESYKYPTADFNRAWAALIMNDEHSYGTSGYQGRRVYETWMHHRDWIFKANRTAKSETESALAALAEKTPGKAGDLLVFNQTAFARSEKITSGGEFLAELPPFGYTIIESAKLAAPKSEALNAGLPPTVENGFYRVKFNDDGSIDEIFDKQLGCAINSGSCNQFIYTDDNHKSFHTPVKAEFTVTRTHFETVVAAKTHEEKSGADITLTVVLPDFEKRIDIDNRLDHVRDMFNTHRYYRYAYFGFPFKVEDCRRFCELGGCEAEYGVDVTGHGTDVYMAAHEYCCIENKNFGVGFVQLDSQLVEFDHIHPDKTDFGNTGDGSELYSYLANDWLQMHLTGSSYLNYRFRYTITSYSGTHKVSGLARLAERTANSVPVFRLTKDGTGELPASRSFLESDARLIGLKIADDGDGLIAHFYKSGGSPEKICVNISGCDIYTPATIIEDEADAIGSGFSTIRIGADKLRPEVRAECEDIDPLEIGGVETGLITEPRVARGEDDGMLYLLWGKCQSPELSHYELYRSETSDFTESEPIRVEPEEFVVGRYIDRGLENHKRYCYRVCAVAKDGTTGAFSISFEGITKEV